VTTEHLVTIPNYLVLSDRVATGGQPRAEQFAFLASAGFEVVINLAMSDSARALVHEGSLVAQQGLVYVHIPVPWDEPRRDHVNCFFDIMDATRQRRVFVHCAKNMRVAVFMFLYRVCREGVPIHLAQADLRRIWQPDGVWRDLMSDVLGDVGQPAAFT
jgi:protein tyrosine phosphatase (PTP) superfamily phosphohydrolase (DUF442 family)